MLSLASCSKTPEQTAARGPGQYLFCFWNVENFFDDTLDHRKGPGDREYDPMFANNPELLELKLKRLCDALLKLNDGKGPDILAIVEVESLRAAELLQKALNARLADRSLHYENVLMKEVAGGRHIAPAILTRLPVVRDRTQLLGARHQRILEGHITVNGHPLVLIASHWSSRLEKGSENRRDHYANTIYGRVRAMYTANPKVDVLICGDFNDTPEDEAVIEHLHATGDIQAVRKPEDGLRLLNLMADKDPNRYGTHFFRRWLIFDQLVVTPGMLDDEGWSCLPDSVRTINTLYNPRDRKHRPWKFGSEKSATHGYSDHFPVTVELKVAGP